MGKRNGALAVRKLQHLPHVLGRAEGTDWHDDVPQVWDCRQVRLKEAQEAAELNGLKAVTHMTFFFRVGCVESETYGVSEDLWNRLKCRAKAEACELAAEEEELKSPDGSQPGNTLAARMTREKGRPAA